MFCEKFEVHWSDYFCIEDFNNNQAHCFQALKLKESSHFPFSFQAGDSRNFVTIKFSSNSQDDAAGFRYVKFLLEIEDDALF